MRGLVGGGWRSGWAEGAREARGGAAQRGRPLSLPPHSPHPTPPPPKGVVGSRTERAQHRPRRLKAAAREEERVQVHEAREHEALALVECVEGVYVVCFVCLGVCVYLRVCVCYVCVCVRGGEHVWIVERFGSDGRRRRAADTAARIIVRRAACHPLRNTHSTHTTHADTPQRPVPRTASPRPSGMRSATIALTDASSSSDSSCPKQRYWNALSSSSESAPSCVWVGLWSAFVVVSLLGCVGIVGFVVFV